MDHLWLQGWSTRGVVPKRRKPRVQRVAQELQREMHTTDDEVQTQNEEDLFYRENSGIGVVYNIQHATDLIKEVYDCDVFGIDNNQSKT